MSTYHDDAKPVEADYDFSDDWLDELEEALDFDAPSASSSQRLLHADPQPNENTTDDVSLDIDVADDNVLSNDLTEQNAELTARPVTATVLNIADLQNKLARENDKTLEMPRIKQENAQLKDAETQLWQFITLIVMRLFDDLELLIVQKNSDEACDFMKQLNRLANILAFAGMDEQLPLLAYIGNLMPISCRPEGDDNLPERYFDTEKMARFAEKSAEILNCLFFLLNYFRKRTNEFDISRYMDLLTTLYDATGAMPGQPSQDAPLPCDEASVVRSLTTRTLTKLTRTLEGLLSESLHYLESAVFYGYGKGFDDAIKSIENMAKVMREYKLYALQPPLKTIYTTLKKLRYPSLPDRSLFTQYNDICNILQQQFPHHVSENRIKNLKALISKFDTLSDKNATMPFYIRWKHFMKAAAPLLNLSACNYDTLRERVGALKQESDKYHIDWLSQTFAQLDARWENFAASCADAFITLSDEIKAFPVDDIDEPDLKQLDHERLRVLFDKRPDMRMPTIFLVVDDAKQLSEQIMQQLESGETIQTAPIYNLMIHAQCVHCPAIVRTCQILAALTEHTGNSNITAETVNNAIAFAAGLLLTLCERIARYIAHQQENPAVHASELFYHTLLALYQTPGQPRDGVSSFIVKQINHILNELQLVWVNTSTPTSTQYYTSLIRKLLHIATLCDLKSLRIQLMEHLDELPEQDFVNTENQSMQRQCTRIIRAVDASCPRLNVSLSSQHVHSFFSKTIAAINQLLSSPNADDTHSLASELSAILSQPSPLGFSADFIPVLAFTFELRHLSLRTDLNRAALEDTLYNMLSIANNVCPEWIEPHNADLAFVRTAMPIPMQLFQEMQEAVDLAYQSLSAKSSNDPVAWENISTLHRLFHDSVSSLPFALQLIVQNAQNRCRYLKKNIFIDLDAAAVSLSQESAISPVLSVSFTSILDKLLEIIIDCGFHATDINSRIDIILQPFAHEICAAVSHNGNHFTNRELLSILENASLVPAPDDNIFDLIVSSPKLSSSYPPANRLAYILPILRQFNGELEISENDQGATFFFLKFPL